MDKQKAPLSAEEKLEAAFQRLLSPKDPAGNDLQFQSAEAKANYQASITRIKDAIQLREPDRVPVTVLPSMFPYLNAGMTVEEAMYDYEKCTAAFKKFILEYQPDMHIGASAPGPGKFYELLDYKLYSWPGHGVAPEHCYQCNEAEYMKADEYDLLISDPSFYFRNFYLPRIGGAFEGFKMLAPFTSILEMYGLAFNFVPFALPPVQASFQKLFEAGAEALKWAMAMGASDGALTAMGFSHHPSAASPQAPFDVIRPTHPARHQGDYVGTSTAAPNNVAHTRWRVDAHHDCDGRQRTAQQTRQRHSRSSCRCTRAPTAFLSDELFMKF
jgi:hypothetical protein